MNLECKKKLLFAVGKVFDISIEFVARLIVSIDRYIAEELSLAIDEVIGEEEAP